MASQDESARVPWKPDPDTALWIAWITAGLFFLLFAVSALGEILGWWGLIGEIGMGIGGIVGVLVALAGLLYGAGSGQVESVDEDVRSNGRSLEAIEEGIVGHGGMVEGLDGVAEALAGEDGMLGELDVVQVELDRQTGVLDRQARILGQIRDRL